MTTYPQTETIEKVPAPTRGYIHSIVGAAFVLLLAFSLLNANEAAAIAGVIIALADLVLVLIYTRATWRKAMYPLLYAGGSALALFGTFNEAQVAAIVGLALTVLGTQVAAAKAPALGS